MDDREELKKLASELSRHGKLLGALSMLQGDARANVGKLRKEREKVLKAIPEMSAALEQVGRLPSLMSELGDRLVEIETERGLTYARELDEALKPGEQSLSGQIPELTCGVFTIAVASAKDQVEIWYGPKQEQLGSCEINAGATVKLLKKLEAGLGSGLPAGDVLPLLCRAVRETAGETGDKRIVDVLGRMAFLRQAPRFLENPAKENFVSYGRADFSSDLFRLHRKGGSIELRNHLKLTVATRNHTRSRKDHLWIPDDPSGRGTYFSHIRLLKGLV
jgi:hypothetical protein